jgi:O-methyltransferase domain
MRPTRASPEHWQLCQIMGGRAPPVQLPADNPHYSVTYDKAHRGEITGMSDSASKPRMPRVDDRALWDVYWGAYGAFAIHIAHAVGIFTYLADGPRTLPQVCEALKLKRRPAEALLSIAAANGFLELRDGRYGLTAAAEDYLLPDSPTYFGGQLDWNLAHPEILMLDRLKRAVLTDRPQAYGTGEQMFRTHEDEAAFARQFTRAMHSASMGPAMAWPEKIDLSQHRLMLDVGGGGAHSIGALLSWPNLKAVVLDRPPVCEVAREYATKHDLANRIETHSADMWDEAYPATDVHFYGMIFHDWPADRCCFLARKSFQSLPSGGRVIVHEMLFNEDRAGPPGVAAFNMVMLMYVEGEQYSSREISAFLADAGFRQIEVKPTFGYWGVVTGVKP